MIRRARKEDITELVELVFIILRDMELSILQKIPEAELKKWIQEAMKDSVYRFSYNRAKVYSVDEEIAGVCFSYPGSEENIIDEPLKRIVEREKKSTSFNLHIDSEAYDNEWYIDSIVTKAQYRGQGIASTLLLDAEVQAKENGFSVLSLNCEKENKRAKSVYTRNGFVKIDDWTIANHQYDHMVKKISL